PPAPPMPDLPSSTTHQARYQALLADTCWSVMVPSSSGASPKTYPSTRRSVLLGPTLIRPPSASNPHPITPLPATAAYVGMCVVARWCTPGWIVTWLLPGDASPTTAHIWCIHPPWPGYHH